MSSIPYTAIFSRGGIQDKIKHTFKGVLKNGTHSLPLMFKEVADIGYDVIIGRNSFQLFGYKLTGIPVKSPGLETYLEEVNIPKGKYNILERAPFESLDLRIQKALEENRKIEPLSHCTHPLAILDFVAKEPLTYFNNKNFVKVEDMERGMDRSWSS